MRRDDDTLIVIRSRPMETDARQQAGDELFHFRPTGEVLGKQPCGTRVLGAVRDGYAEAVARMVHKARTLIVIDTEIRDAGGRLVARTSRAQPVLSPR
jgi:hypothetical protein